MLNTWVLPSHEHHCAHDTTYAGGARVEVPATEFKLYIIQGTVHVRTDPAQQYTDCGNDMVYAFCSTPLCDLLTGLALVAD
jgi:hypothetical protein